MKIVLLSLVLGLTLSMRVSDKLHNHHFNGNMQDLQDLNFDDLDDFPVFYLPDDFDLNSLGFDHLGGEPSLAKFGDKTSAHLTSTLGSDLAMGSLDSDESDQWLPLLVAMAQVIDNAQVGVSHVDQ